MSGRRFDGVKASTYVFRESDGNRDVVALFAGSKKIAFIEFDAIDKLVDRLRALQDQQAAKDGEHEDIQEPSL